MIFETGHLYHVYNQGNNRQIIFFNRENYLFFLRRMREYILPYAKILAWCLMPNHFHLMIYLHTLEVPIEGFTPSETLNKRSFNNSLGILLRSYTRAINNQENLNGSLFRKETKAQCLTKQDGLTPVYFNTMFGAQINTHYTESEYPQVCFNYIHLNPVMANLTRGIKDWEFSSAPDYLGDRTGNLVDKTILKEFAINLDYIEGFTSSETGIQKQS